MGAWGGGMGGTAATDCDCREMRNISCRQLQQKMTRVNVKEEKPPNYL